VPRDSLYRKGPDPGPFRSRQPDEYPHQEEEKLTLLPDRYVREHHGRPGTSTQRATLVAVLLVSLAGAAPASVGERPVKTPVRVPRVENSIRVDGRLEEPVWERALVMAVDNEVRPGDNVPAPVHTDMLLAYSETHFYVAFRAEDPDPSRIYAHLCDHDEMWDDEWVVIGIDTYNDQRGGYEFACNPLGIQGDTASGIHGDGNTWDGIWDSAGRIFDWGYSVEMAIPFSTLRFQRVSGDQVWGVDAVRSYPREVRHHISLYPRDRDDNCYRCQMDKLVGFQGATPGRNLEIDPTVSVVASQFREDFPTGDFYPKPENLQPESEFGVTARWGVTPNITLAGAVNPDFSQVEADAFQLDVNRQFALWYEEKRPFFLESAGAFDNFYSRSIASPIWAGKVTAKAGDNTFGALVARDELTNLIVSGSQSSGYAPLDMESTAATLRYARDIGDMSNVSTYFNSREGGDYHNRVAGAELEVWFTENANLSLEGSTSLTQYPGAVLSAYEGQPEGDFSGGAYEISAGHYTSGLDVYANYSDVDDDFRTDLDFMPRVGYRHAEAGAGHTWQRGAGSWWTMFNVGGCYTHEELQNGTKYTRGANIWVNHEGPSQSFADLNGWAGKKVFAGEEFDTWELDLGAGFWPSSSLFTFASLSYGEEVDYDNVRTGRELIVSPSIELKLGRGLSTEMAYEFERFTVEGDELYHAHLSRLKAVYQFSRRLFVRGILQHSREVYNTALYADSRPDLEENESYLSSQVLLSYKLNPQTVFFLGYSDSHRGDQDIDLTQSGRTVFAKIGYAWVL